MLTLTECPFCGSDNVLFYESKNRSRYYKYGNGYFVYVKCDTCGAQSRSVWAHEQPSENNWDISATRDVAMLWNARAT